MENLVELCRRNSHDSCLLVNHAFCEHIGSHLESCETCPLADTALEHPELAFLNRELDVLHIVEVVLEMCADLVQFLVNLRHCGLEGLEVLVLV